MKLVFKETWGYAVLLVILFCIAAIAVGSTLSYLHGLVPAREIASVSLLIWSLTLGFMFIAGAFGLFVIQFSAESEGRRRVGRFVDAMDYLQDGLLAVDRKGRVNGMNAAARSLHHNTSPEADALETLGDFCSCLTDDDVHSLLQQQCPTEVEREYLDGSAHRRLRFRSQPAEGITLILVSDVTAMHAQRAYNRQVARLQLIGQLARGVANDFNNLLCAISSHAALLSRINPASPELPQSVQAIVRAADRGIELAGHLLELSHPAQTHQATAAVADHIRNAASTLRDSLSSNWEVKTEIEDGLPAVGLSGIQVEQITHNLGLLAADACPRPAALLISACPVARTSVHSPGRQAVTLLVGTDAPDPQADAASADREFHEESGVILSVVRSMVQEAGGHLDCLPGRDGSTVYRVALPYPHLPNDVAAATALPAEFKAYVSGWSVLIAIPARRHGSLDDVLSALGVHVHRVTEIASALARLEDEPTLDALVLDAALLRDVAAGLLRAVVKLRPSAGIVVIAEQATPEAMSLSKEVVSVPPRTDTNAIILAMVEARGMAVKRVRSGAKAL